VRPVRSAHVRDRQGAIRVREQGTHARIQARMETNKRERDNALSSQIGSDRR